MEGSVVNHNHETLGDWLAWLETLHPKNIELGLSRIQKVADRLQLSEQIAANNCSITTVAGTNGKGSFVRTLESLLIDSGETVGGFTSPHFLHYNERIRVNGKDASDRIIVDAFQEINEARQDTSLTYFEFGALAAVLVFLKEKVKHIVLEVGLGGRLDAVNIFDADITAITSIDLDHQDWLGSTRELIGFEKAGIFRPRKPAIVVDEDIPKSILTHAKAVGANLFIKNKNLDWVINSDTWTWKGQNLSERSAEIDKDQFIVLKNLPLPQLPLPSVAAALQAFVLLGGNVEYATIAKSLSSLSLMGRFQQRQIKGRNFALDVAHNPAAAKYLANKLESLAVGKVIAVFAVMNDKDYLQIMGTLSKAVDYWMVCGLQDIPRAATSDDLKKALKALGLAGESFSTVKDGVAAALDHATRKDLILVLGSFFTVAEVLSEEGFTSA
ncbi:bifunctional tetrahydrofolate synthase/dihydrofolate synthase [Aurantivibrio infirmus]